MTAVISGGTIPDRGLYTVNLPDRTRLGELDEEFVHESRVGDVFQLGSATWRMAAIEHDRVIVDARARSARAHALLARRVSVAQRRALTPGRPGRRLAAVASWTMSRADLDAPRRSRFHRWTRYHCDARVRAHPAALHRRAAGRDGRRAR